MGGRGGQEVGGEGKRVEKGDLGRMIGRGNYDDLKEDGSQAVILSLEYVQVT